MKSSSIKRGLLIGIGNDARGDDGLGWAFLKKLEGSTNHYDIVWRYQLQVEDAELISRYPEVVFVDACQTAVPNGFALEKCKAVLGFDFSTHAVEPTSILALCQELYQAYPLSYIFKIQGYHWDLGKTLSTAARKNLENALDFWHQRSQKVTAPL